MNMLSRFLVLVTAVMTLLAPASALLAQSIAPPRDPAKIQKALRETDLKPEQLMIGYRGVKFDETGQNTLSATYLIQLQGKDYKSVWPADRATAKLAWPMTGWRK